MNSCENTETCKQLVEKIDILLEGITYSSHRDTDLKIAQTVQALSKAYKNLKGSKR